MTGKSRFTKLANVTSEQESGGCFSKLPLHTKVKNSSHLNAMLCRPLKLLLVLNILFTSGWFNNDIPAGPNFRVVAAVSVRRLNVPDLVVIDQLNQQQLPTINPNQARSEQQKQQQRTMQNLNYQNQPEAASLINTLDLNSANMNDSHYVTFECLISFDKTKDKNLIVKWHHDERHEPIYQWIPELNKRSIAPRYMPYIVPLVSQQQAGSSLMGTTDLQHNSGPSQSTSTPGSNSNQIQLLEAGFRMVRPSKELGGKYTCSAISTQNDDSKWKKMIVYTPPRYFRFNASRTDIGAQLASHRERLIQLSQPTMIGSSLLSNQQQQQQQQLPLAYRMRGFEGPTTISPQMYSTIDYVNVNQLRSRQSSASSSWLVGPATVSPHPESATSGPVGGKKVVLHSKQANGVKLVCDIDQVFPVPEVSIYRLAKLDGSHPDKLAKLDTRIERNPLNGLYHVQVISVLEDDELQMKYGINEPVYFECLIALTNLELSKYADNKRSIVYRPGLLLNNQQTSEDLSSEQTSGNNAAYSNRPYLGFMLLLATWSLYITGERLSAYR